MWNKLYCGPPRPGQLKEISVCVDACTHVCAQISVHFPTCVTVSVNALSYFVLCVTLKGHSIALNVENTVKQSHVT